MHVRHGQWQAPKRLPSGIRTSRYAGPRDPTADRGPQNKKTLHSAFDSAEGEDPFEQLDLEINNADEGVQASFWY